MRKKRILRALSLLCVLLLSASSLCVLAEEEVTEAVTEEVSEEPEEEVAEEATEEESEESTKEAYVSTVRPTDYRALDYVELGDYLGFTVQLTAVTDEEVLEEAESRILESDADVMQILTEGTVEEGDLANIDYVGKLDGEAFDGGTASGYDLEIGSGVFIEGFEDGLIGKEIGSTVDLDLTFPENYSAEELAGKDTVFTVTINEVQRLPELTGEIVSAVTDGAYSEVDSWLNYIRASLEEEARESEVENAVVQQIYSDSTISGYPQDVLEYCENALLSYYGVWLEYYGYTEDEISSWADQMAKSELQLELLLKAIAETEGMEISEDEYNEGASAYAAEYGYDSIQEFVDSNGGEDYVRLNLLLDKVLNFLVENTTVLEPVEPESESELGEEFVGEEETEFVAEEETEAVTGEETEFVTEPETESEAETAS